MKNKTIATFVLSALVIGAFLPQVQAQEVDLFAQIEALTERNERIEQRLLVLEERVLELEYMAEKFAISDRIKILPHPEPVFNCVTEPCILPEELHSDITTQYLVDNSEPVDEKAVEAQEKRAEAIAEKKANMSEEKLEKRTHQAENKADKEMPVNSNPWWKFW